MAYGIRGLGKLHRIKGRHPMRLDCTPSLSATRKVNCQYALEMEQAGLLCGKCFPNGQLPLPCNTCGAESVINLDGDNLCHKHANDWVRAEGQAAREIAAE